MLTKYRDLRAYLDTLPQDSDSYGLVHSDFYFSNFFVDDSKITLFDFDDCCYAWFVYDIAMSLFYTLSHNSVHAADLAKGRHFLSTYMEGYLGENNLDLRWFNADQPYADLDFQAIARSMSKRPRGGF